MGHARVLGIAAATSVLLGAAGAATPAGAAPGDVPSFGYDVRGSRHNPNEAAITPANVGTLELKWAFVVPKAMGQQSQPAVVGDTIYFGGRNGVFYALSRRTGRKRWSRDTKPFANFTPSANKLADLNALRDAPAVAGGNVYFGDSRGHVIALTARTGRLRWITKVDTNPFTIMTSSPVVHEGKVIVGVSSNEEAAASAPAYPCCTFRGSLVALAADTGALLWRYVTGPEPQPTGAAPGTGPAFAPSGVAIWSSPSVDPATDTVFVGTGNDYTGQTPRGNTIVAVDANSGQEKWFRQLAAPDTWNFQCAIAPGIANCPTPGSDFDFGAGPNVFSIGGRTVVGEGQKSGVYHVLDAATGEIVWQSLLATASGKPEALGLEGVQWGTSYDGTRIYAATNQAKPGALFALDPADGRQIWKRVSPLNSCRTGGAAKRPKIECARAFPAPVSSSPGIVWEGGQDGKVRAYSSATGKTLWRYDTVRAYRGTNGILGVGGSIDAAGAVVSHGMLYLDSGYLHFGIPLTEMQGNVVLAFGLP
jgi:polyvinyl alcohol dehydrogenase (cytochrome)